MSVSGQYSFLDNKNLIGIWDEAYEPALNNLWAMKLGTLVESDKETESYGWLGAAPGLEPVVSDSWKEEQLGKYAYALRNIDFAKTLKIQEKDMRRDKIGQLEIRIGDMSERAAEHWNVLTSQVIATNPVGYDGVSLFSSAHNESGTAQVNDLSATQIPALDVVTPTAPTPVEAAAALNAVIGNFYNLVDDKKYPINGQAKSFTVLCGSTNIWASMNYAVNALTFAGGQTNQIQGLMTGNGLKIDVELIPQLNTFTTGFYVFRNDSKVKALILQEEVPVEPMVSTRDNDEFIKSRRFLFSIYASRAVGVARWQSAARATFS